MKMYKKIFKRNILNFKIGLLKIELINSQHTKTEIYFPSKLKILLPIIKNNKYSS